MGEAATVDAAEDKPPVVPNFSCRRRTSRGGLATEFTNAILTCRPARTKKTFKHSVESGWQVGKGFILKAEQAKTQFVKRLCNLLVCWHVQRRCSG